MAEQEAKALAEEEDAVVVEFKDEDGNSFLYEQEMIIPVNGENFALLFGIQQEDQEHEHGCGCGCEDDDGDVIIAKVIVNEDGEEEYVEPSDEEFEAVQKAYDELLKDLDVEEEEKEKEKEKAES